MRTALAALLLLAGSAPALGQCDPALWKHVYNPDRLEVKKPCVTVHGTIVDATAGRRRDGVRHEPDGDPHGWLRLDPGQEQYLNAGNVTDEEGNLVYEIPCLFPVTQEDAKEACKDYRSPLRLLPVGSHVCMQGTLVQERRHKKWMEIHPVSRMYLCEKKAARGRDIYKGYVSARRAGWD